MTEAKGAEKIIARAPKSMDKDVSFFRLRSHETMDEDVSFLGLKSHGRIERG